MLARAVLRCQQPSDAGDIRHLSLCGLTVAESSGAPGRVDGVVPVTVGTTSASRTSAKPASTSEAHRRRALASMFTVLKPGGKLVIADYGLGSRASSPLGTDATPGSMSAWSRCQRGTISSAHLPSRPSIPRTGPGRLPCAGQSQARWGPGRAPRYAPPVPHAAATAPSCRSRSPRPRPDHRALGAASLARVGIARIGGGSSSALINARHRR